MIPGPGVATFSPFKQRKKNIYKQLVEKKKGSGSKKKSDMCSEERAKKCLRGQEVYLREFTKLMHHTSGIPINADGSVSFTTKYVQSASGYRGRVYAEGVALSKVPRRLRQIAYEGMAVRDWDVAMAYFTFATQIVDKLGIQIASPHFNMDTLRLYIMDKRTIWNSINENSNLSDDECKQLCNAVFNGEKVDDAYMSNSYVRNISREGRAMRWIAGNLMSDVYDKLTADAKKGWAEASAQSYLIAGVEARVLGALADHCNYLCRSGQDCALDHISLQFDGADILMRPFPPNFKTGAEEAIKTRTGYEVNIVEKRHEFFIDAIIDKAAEVERYTHPPQTSVLYDQGNCIILAIYRHVGDVDVYNTYCEVAMSKPLSGKKVRSYRDCVDYTKCCELSPVDVGSLKVGGRYLIHADGRSEEPHCLSMYIDHEGAAKISTSSVMYSHRISDVKDIIRKSVDKPILLQYQDTKISRSVGSENSAKLPHLMLLNLQAGMRT